MYRVSKSKADYLFDAFNYTMLIFMSLLFIFPFWQIVVLSFSDPVTANSLGLKIVPKKLFFESYHAVFTNQYVYIGYLNTIIRTVLGVVLSVFVTYCGAYVLSKRNLPLRGTLTSIVFFTMFFGGGLIPSYLLIKNLHMLDSYWALILPALTSPWSIIVARNYIYSIPDSLEEAASVDGAQPITIAFKIILPVCMPIIAVLALWSAVHHWNAWFDAMIYISSNKKLVLQLVLRRMIISNSPDMMSGGLLSNTTEATTPETIKAATIVVSILPILMVYPFLQKYFVKGIMIGSIKG